MPLRDYRQSARVNAVQEAQRQIVNALTAFLAERWFDDVAAAVGANDAR